MLDAARRLFVERGWAGATVADIAKAAEVGVQTVYFTFGDKRALLRELLDTAVAGDSDPVATLDRPWARAVLDEPDPAVQFARQAAGAREILERAAPVLEVVRGAAAADERMAELWRLNREQRYTVQLSFARALTGKVPGPLRDKHDAAAVADVATVLLGPETYGPLVTEAGWSPPRWERWAGDSLVRQFLP
ncbi:TetR/AcrR family transcriptional regulator [Streptomyces sp. OF3]|uniref:TetR family transcriptional regulator n=2 Tax=Streptomyces alkaliterrae TaxID=2213162 RepID=A0A5P0YT70_9ACTN|nr:TetR/AcrR family transcriptional regulator [Streptomyces alkaliterrae]MBB1259883.1 TetR/AcrR family transcriptional regulator [Streptomyces alkaliterrae]MQS02817.1 TetR family transcriptional regulator [Streptomyces alkaliterrae]